MMVVEELRTSIKRCDLFHDAVLEGLKITTKSLSQGNVIYVKLGVRNGVLPDNVVNIGWLQKWQLCGYTPS
jgi:hypothetical protein